MTFAETAFIDIRQATDFKKKTSSGMEDCACLARALALRLPAVKLVTRTFRMLGLSALRLIGAIAPPVNPLA